jgi:energy-coupling factor transport system ATP-binding protein
VTTAIEVEDVSFAYPDGTRALEEVSLEIGAGSRVAIIGQNGSGKSTLVRHFNGLLRPSKGAIRLDGSDTAGRHVAELARTVALLFQNPDRQIFASSVQKEVTFGPRNAGLRGDALDHTVARALASVGMTDAAETHPYDLGFSRRKLLALASVLAMETPVVVLDEPTTGQDARGIALIQRIIGDLHSADRTVIAISHDMRFVAESFDRVVVMRSGRVVLDSSPGDVFAEPNWPMLASTYLDPPLPSAVGAHLGLGSTPTEAALVEAVTRSAAPGPA